jgi:chromosome segregation protein
MRLKKLTLIGFKSFADKTTLHFDPGITCIVGPNGCGKSNIADAFRWVLGEQSAKSMRGSKMPDIIFSGTQSRQSLNIAEVSLTLTDIQGQLPLDYEEITLTRRLHKTGESEYLMNGHVVRLKDLRDLFLDSGIGRNAYFEQGKVDQIIQQSPLERRHLFEEAAGILRFLQRKHETLKRLEQADLNFLRVQDIQIEVEKQMKVLQEQAAKAKLFKENRAQLENLEKSVYVLRWNLLEKKRMEADHNQTKQQERLHQLNQVLVQLQEKNQDTKSALQQSEERLRLEKEVYFKCQNEKEIQKREFHSSQMLFQELEKKSQKIKQEIEESQLSHQTRQQSFIQLREQFNHMSVEYQDMSSQLTSQQEKVKLKEKEVGQLRQEFQSKQQQNLKFVQNENHLDSECKQQRVRLENHKERKKGLEIRKSRLDSDLNQFIQLAQEKKQQLNHMSQQVDSYKECLQQYESKLKSTQIEIEKRQKELDFLRRKLVEQKARQKVLLRMREDREGFSSGSKHLLQSSVDPSHLLFNKIRPLYEFLNSNLEIAEAIAIILRSYAYTLVVDTKNQFDEVLTYAQNHQLQDYSLICLEWIEKERIHRKKEKESPFLDPLSSHLLAKHFLQAIQQSHYKNKNFPGVEAWVPTIGFFDHYGVFFDARSQENHLFLRESELRHLEEEIFQRETQLKKEEMMLQELQQTKSKLQTERTEADKSLRRDEMKLVEINFGLQKALSDQNRIKQENEQVEKDLHMIEQHVDQQCSSLEKLQTQHLSAKQDLSQLQGEMERLEKELDLQTRALRMQQQDHREKGTSYQRLTDEKQQLMHQINLMELKEQEHQKQEGRLKREYHEICRTFMQVKEKEQESQKLLEILESKVTQIKSTCIEVEKEVKQYKESLEQLDQVIQEQHHLIKQGETEHIQWTMQATQIHINIQALKQELQDRYQLTIEEAKSHLPDSIKSLDQTEKQIRSIRQVLQALGDVNLTSIEELEKYQTRHQFLKQQMEDMSVSKDELLRLIKQLDGESRQLFKETFELIRANFKKNFQILFSGGEADLHFTDTHDILEAGIEITAKPPGKQMRSIMLLSGGEKCLTAVALLFAIFEVKPAPFCILDEIDAPLDDANIERFVNVVKHFVDRCQFLIITHNKRTMAIGNVLFGISMEEKGISKLLSLEFSQETSPVLVEG